MNYPQISAFGILDCIEKDSSELYFCKKYSLPAHFIKVVKILPIGQAVSTKLIHILPLLSSDWSIDASFIKFDVFIIVLVL